MRVDAKSSFFADVVYAPRPEYDQSGQRIYAEMHTADWWWDVQVLPRSLFYVKAY